MFAVTILGNNSAVPAFDRHPTSQMVTLNGHQFLVDCGEGTQIQLINYKIRRSKISHIFISHLHGDHYFGLVGLLNTFNLLGRIQKLHVFGPAQLQAIIELQLNTASNALCYPLHFHTVSGADLLVDDNQFEIRSFPTSHRIECYGYSFKEKKLPRKLIAQKIEEYKIPKSDFTSLQMGNDWKNSVGEIVKNNLLTESNTSPRGYAFCADTKYDEAILPHIQNLDLIYHESTYTENLRDKAIERFHSTSKQAAAMAKKANAKKLLLGHFSSKYENLTIFEEEAKEVFPNVNIATEGVSFLV